MDDYGYYDLTTAAKVNREAAQDYLDFHKANESEIVKLLSSFISKYRELKNEYYALPAGKIKLAKKHINEKTDLLYQLANVMTVESAKYIAHSYYSTYVLSGVENKIENLERNYRNGELNIIIACLNLTNNKIQIKLDANDNLINIIMDGHKVQACKKDFIELCLFKSFPKPYTSREKAESFKAHYLQKAEKIKKSAKITLNLIKDLQGNINKLETEAKTAVEEENYALYIVKYKEFETELTKAADNRISAYVKKAPDSKLKKQVLKSLKNSQKAEMDKNPQNKELVTFQTVVNLLADIDAGLVNLGESLSEGSDIKTNKGME